ncbi:4'-demethylrebeccamycin synthase [Pseudoruegeria aquimaris]|uniref:4'-demethylrebeccamycin synthase n=1 Tax=Pseudoruegeria aquimaris TaxID=393663 RepID=A0A1Y5RVR5_9RHOB|nr:glycosyltransferase [Pseudoruegeria aquimaris]SLN23934.1 4'-demethylrebeccamycin synthase [Pseudoruegeria aquimaris]
MRQGKPYHVLLATIGSAGDVFPYMEIGRVLKAQGHRVTLMTTPLLAEMVADHGLDFAPFGDLDQLKSAAKDPKIHGEASGPGAFWDRLVAPNLLAIRRFVEALPKEEHPVVLCHTFLVPAAALARSAGRPITIINPILQPAFIRSALTRQTFGVPKLGPVTFGRWMPAALRRLITRKGEDRMINAPMLPALNALRHETGLPPVESFFGHIQEAADLYVPLFPTWFAAPQADWPAPRVQGDFIFYQALKSQAVSPELQGFLDSGPAPVVFTAGTGNFQANRLYSIAIPVLKRLGLRAVFLTHVRDQLPDPLPEGMLWQPYAPFDKILPSACALVQHGGIGTTAEALRAGVPQLVTPFGYDQYDNARRIREMGAGTSVPFQHLTEEKFEKALSGLLATNRRRPTFAGSMATEEIVAAIFEAIGPASRS